jgi:putative endonuclease
VSFGQPPKCSTATAAASSGVESLAREHVDVAAAGELVGVDGQRARLDELHRRPPLELTLAEPLEHQRAMSTHADGLDDDRHEAPDRLRSASASRSQSCRSMTAIVPQGVTAAGVSAGAGEETSSGMATTLPPAPCHDVAHGLAAGGRGCPPKSPRMPFVYLLRCADGSLYCGWTTDIERRLTAHRAGKASRYTRSRLPVELATVFEVPDRSTALREEARIKRLPREAKLAL